MKCWLFLMLFVVFTNLSFAQKMKPEDVLSKHLDSISAAENRAKLTSLITVGDATVTFISPKSLNSQGRIVMASSGEKSFLGMNLNASDYPSEKLSFDGKKVKAAFIRPGVRSVLGSFIASNNLFLKQSLLGGTLSTSWALLNLADSKGKLTFEGTRKVGEKEAYVLGYSPKGGGDFDIKLFFDKENFQHIRTEYKRTSSAGIGLSPEQSSRLIESRLKITEIFSDFKAEQNFKLPHSYILNYSITGQNGTTEIEWTFNLTEFAFNQKFDDKTFDAEAK